jgi:hypothetical protein
MPELKKIEDERKVLEKKLTTVGIISFLLAASIGFGLLIILHNLRVLYFIASFPAPYAFFYKDLIKTYSKKYKETVIKNLFESYFDKYVIDTDKHARYNLAKRPGLFSFLNGFVVLTEDYIDLTFKGQNISIQEVLIKNGNETLFKGIIASIDLTIATDATILLIPKKNYLNSNYFIKNGFKSINENEISILYNNDFNRELFNRIVDFSISKQITLSIQDRKIFCLISSDNIILNSELDLFEPKLFSKYNSGDTFRFIKEEYARISKFSNILLNLEKINVP